MHGLALLLLLAQFTKLAYSHAELVITAPAGHYLLPVGWSILQEAYAPLSIDIRMLELPPARALVYVSDGNADAELARVAGIEQDFPNLQRVPEPLITLYLVAVSRSADATLPQLQRARRGHLVIRRGARYVEDLTASWRPVQVDTVEQQLNLLRSGRADYALVESLQPQFNLPVSAEVPLYQTMLAEVPIYHYVHEKHQALIPLLTASLKQLHQSGRIAELIIQFEQEQIAAAVTEQQ